MSNVPVTTGPVIDVIVTVPLATYRCHPGSVPPRTTILTASWPVPAPTV